MQFSIFSLFFYNRFANHVKIFTGYIIWIIPWHTSIYIGVPVYAIQSFSYSLGATEDGQTGYKPVNRWALSLWH